MSGMFLDSYAVTDVLGSGRFSTVIGVRCLSTNRDLAIKLVSKADVAAAMQQRSKGGGVSPPMGATPPPQPPDWGDGNNAVAAAATNNRGRGPTLSSGKALPERWADEAHAITHGLSSLSRLSDGAGPSPQAVPVQQGGPLRLKRIRTEYYVLLEQLRERHPLLVDVERIGHTNSFLFFAMKRYRRNLAELLRAPNSVRNTVLSEDQARFVTIETMLALEYLHYRGIVYRDLKPENILLTDDLHVVLSDFDLSHAPAAHDDLLFMELQETQMGLGVIPCSTGQAAGLTTVAQALSHQSKASSGSSSSFSTASTSQHHDAPAVTIATPVVSPRKHPLPGSPRPVSAPHHHTSSATSGSGSVHHQRNTSFVGTVEYLSPDVLKDDVVSPAIDMWSLGMLLYEMLFGFTAFRGNNESDTLFKLNEYISKGSDAKLSFPVSPSVSDEAKDLLQRLLCATKDLRLTPDDVRAHPWMARSSVVNIKMARDVHRMNSPLAAMVNHHDVHGASGDGGTTTVSANRYAKFLNKTPRTRPRGATTSTAEPSAQASAQDASARNALEVAADAKKDHVERHVASLRNEEMQTDGAVGVGLSFFFPVKKGPPPLQRTKEEIMRQFQPDALSACVSSPSLLRAALNEDTGAHEALPESREARGSWWSRLRASV